MKTFFATALISSALAVELEKEVGTTNYLGGNYPGGARKHGYYFSHDEFHPVYPTGRRIGRGPHGQGIYDDGVSPFATPKGSGRYLAIADWPVRTYTPIKPAPEAEGSTSDSESHSIGSDSFSETGSLSDSDDGQHDTDSGSANDTAENDTAFTQGPPYGFPDRYFVSASEASSFSDYSLSERFDSTDSNPESDGSADTFECEFVKGIYTCHKHTQYQRDNTGIVDGERKEDKHFDFSKYEVEKKAHVVSKVKDADFDGRGEGPYQSNFTKRGVANINPFFGKQ